MQKMTGFLNIMRVTEIIQWLVSSKRTGTLILIQDDRQNKIYFQDGKIIYIWSNCEADETVNFLECQSHSRRDELASASANSEALGLPLIGYLLSQKFFSSEQFEALLKEGAETLLTSVLTWDTGTFDFDPELPQFLLNSPIGLNTFHILFESTLRLDESHRDSQVDAEMVMNKIRGLIQEGGFELPPMPEVMQQLAEKIDTPTISIDEIVACITDQILVSKILKIFNSPYYGRHGHASSLKDAVVFIGLKSLMSIVTVHAMSSYSPRNSRKIKGVLQHSLVCAMIARQIARDMSANFELAFICGLLHDIGKTILLEMLSDFTLPPDLQVQLIEENHSEMGYVLAQQWNFGSDITDVIRYHHTPELAADHTRMAEIINLADTMSYLNGQPVEVTDMAFTSFDLSQINVDDILGELDTLGNEASHILDT